MNSYHQIPKWKKRYLKLSFEKYVIPAMERFKRKRDEWMEMVGDADYETAIFLNELAEGTRAGLRMINRNAKRGDYVEDWMCDREGAYFDMHSYYRDQIARCNEEIIILNGMKKHSDCKEEHIVIIDKDIEKYKRFIGGYKKKLFDFKLKINTKRQLHNQQMRLEKEIRSLEVEDDE